MSTRLLYVTHVDWGHIRQRPHHLAAALATHFDVTVAYPVSRHRSRAVANPHPGVRLAPIIRPPGSYRSATLFRVANAVATMQLRFIMARHRPAVVLVTAPECFLWLGRFLSTKVLGYDCMDDVLAFAQDASVRALKAGWERALLKRADFVACTTETLLGRCVERGATTDKLSVVRNGWDPSAFPVQESRPLPLVGPFTAGYFGTIAEWLDFAALETIVSAIPELTIRLIGPNACGYVSKQPRLILEPPVEHAALARAVRGFDLFLYPFRVDELTRAVDPVKLYEYVALGRPILAVRYPELQPFASFVTFYQGTDDFVRLLRNRSTAIAAAASFGQREAWLRDAMWSERARAMVALVESSRHSVNRATISELVK